MSLTSRRFAGAPIVIALALVAGLGVLSSCSTDNGSVTFGFCDPDCDGVEGPFVPWFDCDPGASAVDTVMNDRDDDHVGDNCDNCPDVSNDFQIDTDLDGLGNACDTDDDGDGVLDATDTCPLLANPAQETTDTDADTVPDACDNCDNTANPRNAGPVDCNADGDHLDFGEALNQQCDQDFDGVGDACDADEDGDGYKNDGANNGATYTPCPTGAALTVLCDDNCSQVPNGQPPAGLTTPPAQQDTDGDGIGDACEGG